MGPMLAARGFLAATAVIGLADHAIAQQAAGPYAYPVRPGEIYIVEPDGTETLGAPTIQDGIDAASDGAALFLGVGTYTGPGNKNVFLAGKNVTLTGLGNPGDVVIDCEGSGRGFLISGSAVTTATEFRNITIQNGNVPDFGGAVFTGGASPRFKGCFFLNNFALLCGGAFAGGDADVGLAHCVFEGNTSGSGGGVCLSRMDGEILSSTFVDNTVESVGGGLAITANGITGLQIKNCDFYGNEAGQAGGALYSELTTDLLIHAIKAIDNESFNGGGLYLFGNLINPDELGAVILRDSIIAKNTGVNGGGILSQFLVTVIQNCNVVDNTATTGGGVFGLGAAGLFLLNSIVWGNVSNEASVVDQQVRVPNPLQYIILYNDVQGTDFGSINMDPQFRDPENCDYRPLSTSPCIDAGLPDFVPAPNEGDIRNRARVAGGRVDIGAYELQRTPLLVR